MSRVDDIINGVKKNGTQKKKSRVESIIESSSKGNLKTGVDESFINSFLSDAKDYLSNVGKDAENIGYKNASSLYDDYSSKGYELGKRADKIRAHLNSNKGNLDNEAYESLISTLDTFDKNHDTTSAYLKRASDHYSRWETEEEYNEAVKAEEERNKKANLDTDSAQKEIDELESILTEAKNAKTKQSAEDAKAKREGKYTAPSTKKNAHRYAGLVPDSVEEKWAEEDSTPTPAYLEKLKEYGYSDLDELEADISQKKAYLTQAQRLQKTIAVTEEALNAEDYGTYNAPKAELAEGNLTYKYINDVDGYRQEIKSWYDNHSTYTTDTGMVFPTVKPAVLDHNFEHMTDDEVGIYNYYYSKFGIEKANEYLDLLQETLNTRSAAKIREDYDTDIERMLFAVAAGLDQFESGVENLFNFSDDYITPSDKQIASGMIREDLKDSGAKLPDWLGGESIGQAGYDLINTTSNMLPSIATSSIVGMINPVAGQIVGAGLMGTSAAGNAYAEALNAGYDKGQARTYSLLVGGSEAGLSYLLGGIGKLGGKLTGNATSKIATKLTANVNKAWAKMLVSGGTKLVGNMVSEFGEEYLQEVLTPVFKNFALKTEEDVNLLSADAFYAGFLGALSAGVLESGGTVVGEVGTYNLGKSVIEKGKVSDLVTLGKSFSTDTIAYEIASKIDGNTDAYTLGQLLNEAGAGSLTESNMAEIQKSLERKGVTPQDAQTIAKWLNKAVEGRHFSKSQIEALSENEVISATFRDVILNQKSTVNQRVQSYQDILESLEQENANSTEAATTPADTKPEASQANFVPYSAEYIESAAKEYEALGIPPEQAKALAVAQLSNAGEVQPSPTAESIVESKYEVSADGKTINTKTGNEVKINKIESISSSGEANLTVDDGMVVKASDISFSSPAEATFVGHISNIKLGKKPISTDAANALYQNAMTALKANPKMTDREAMSLIKGLEESYIYGAYNLGRAKLTTKNEDGSARLFAGELSQSQRKSAYELGAKDRVSDAERDQKVIDELVEKAKPKATKKSIGKVIFENGANVDEKSLTDTQKANLEGIKLLAELTSIEFHVFRSEKVGNTFKYTMPDGTVTGANGWFVTGTNQIWVDLNAGNLGEGAMIRTAAHEISHYIKQWSLVKWQAMADLLMDTFAKNGVDTEGLLNRQKGIIKKRYKANKKPIPSEPELLDKAYEELVSEALTDMLTDGSIVNFIAEVKTKDKNLAQRILDAIKNLLKKWGLIIEEYKDRTLDTAEAQALSKFEDVFKQLQEMYRDALMDADAVVATIGARNLADFSEAKNTEGESLFQYRAMEADEATYKDMLKKWGKMTDTQIDNLFTTIDKAMDIIKDNLEVLDYAWEADIDDRAFSPVKPNTDSLYKVSLDFSTLCRKRILQQTIQAQLQEALNQPLTREEGIAIRDALMALQEEGRQIEIACALCYVESARMKSPKQIKKFWNNREAVIKDFFAGKAGGSTKDKIKQAEVDARAKLHKENPNGIKGKNGSTLDPRTAPLGAMQKNYADSIRYAKRAAKESYKPTAEEQSLINVAKGMTINDFVTPSGLENLAKNYPDLFDAYARYIVNATHSKGIENDTWWRAGDSSKIGDVLIANMNKENGLRSQSWSDFQVIHILDYIASTIELSTRNAKEQAYSKVPDYVELMGQTGVMLNMSLIPTRNFNGSLEYDSVEGMAYKRALELREKYPATAGTICIGIDNKQIQMLLADATIDYVIPYHKSGMAATIRKLMHIPTWTQYEDYQSEKNLSRKDAEAQAKKYGVKLLAETDPNYQKHTAFSEWFDLEVAKQIAKMENANPSNKAMQKKYGVMYGGYMAMQDAANNYLKLCAERGLSPKFSHEKADFTAEDNYWKLLIDRKMVNNATGEIIEQQTIQPIFDEGEVLRILNDELERYPSVKADQEYATRKVTEKFLSGEIKSGMSAEAIAEVMKTPVDNITKTNILALTEQNQRLTDSDLDEYMSVGKSLSTRNKKRRMLESGKKPILTSSEEIVSFMYDVIRGKAGGEVRAFAKVGTRLANAVQQVDSSLDIFGDYLELNADDLRESYKRHLSPKEKGDIPLSDVDFQRISEYLDDFDGVLLTNYYKGKKEVHLYKETDEGYVRILAVSSNERGSLLLTKLVGVSKEKFEAKYAKKIERDTGSPRGQAEKSDASNPPTGARLTAGVLSEGIITNPEENVKESSENLFQERDTAPTFYSHMGKVIGEMKQNKIGANDVVRYLTDPKRGVKAEEIRWSGIVPFLEGKKSVTKQELLDFINNSMLQIEETTIDNTETPMTKERKDRISALERERNILVNKVKSEWKRILGTDDIENYAGESIPSDYHLKLTTAVVSKKSATPIGQEYKAAQDAIKKICEESDYFGYDNAKQAYAAILRNPESFLRGNELTATEEAAVKRLAKAKEAWLELEGVPESDVQYLKDLGEDIHRLDGKITSIRIEHRSEQTLPRWSSYKLKGGNNYREIVFKMAGSDYTNEMMDTHWGQFGFKGVLVHARIQDFDVNGKKMLFIEEIQSDWHNEGHKDGYQDDAQLQELEELETKAQEAFFAVEDYSTELTGLAGEYEKVAKTQKGRELLRAKIRAEKALKQAQAQFDTKVPDAPFKDNYHEYVLKRLLRMAAEQGYDSIGWTPADIQDKRWDDHQYHEEGKGKSGNLVGYTIEYDQDMVKFLKKHGRQWGAKVGTTNLPNGTEVWSMDITDSMKNSVLYEGQALYQERDPEASNRYILANSLESAAQNDIEKRRLAEYKEKIALIESEESRLSEIQKKLFTKGEVDPTERKALQFEAKQLSNRINTYDRQLLNLEATTALKNVLNREKALAAKRQKQKDNEALKKYKETVAETQRELMDRYQKSRKKATESRNRTAMRHKIQKVVSELNQLLLKGSKERNVKLGLQESVAKALEVINMDTVGADERIAKHNDLIAKAKDPDVIASLTETRDRIAAQGDRLSDKLEAMRKAYAEIRNNSKEYAPYYQQEAQLIENAIEKVIKEVGDTSIRNMTLEQLEAVYHMYRLVLQTIRYANELHTQGKVEELRENASAMMTELEKIKTLKEERAAVGDVLREFTWNEMIPIYAIRRTGSATLEKFYWELIKGQNTYAQDAEEANTFKSATREKYGYYGWNFDKVHSFKLADGRTFRVTLGHMMSIYAYSKRPQAIDHMSVGGFFFNDKSTFRKKGGVLKMIKSNEAGYTVNPEVLNAIKEEMEKVAKGSTQYVDEMQGYLTAMGAKGNEVSRVVWGIDIFKEKIYFPLKSVKDFIFQSNQPTQVTSLKHDGMTNETKPGASNPIVLETFDDVWAGHVERMSQYHGFVIPIDNMNKLLNYGSWAGTESVSVTTMLRARFGNAVNEYLNQFIEDMNGASSTSGAKNPFISMVGKFKKTAVAASMSVVAQQPAAIFRAMAVMDNKYFLGLPEAHLLSTKWSELKKYAPIAIIKDIGGFDAGGGRQVKEWLNSDARRGADKVLGKIDDITMKGAAIGDQVGWCAIWEAVKRETQAKHKDLKVGSEEFLKKAGERFTKVIVLTQVYDSTLSRSGYMRSKRDSVKMLTSFMGEPTVSINMEFDAILQAKRGTITKRNAGKILGATYAATIAASVAASLIYALRDDDDDESYLEKFAEAFGDKLLGDLNPLNQLPGVKDIISIFEGWDVERTDMAIFKDIKDAFDGLSSENKSTWRKVEDFAGAMASIFGVPLKNLLRTAREIYNGVNAIFDDIQPKDVDDAFVRGVKGEKKDKSKALYDAIVSGDEARLKVYRDGYEDEDAYMNAVKTAIAKNNPDVIQTASDLINANFSSYQDMVDELVNLGFDRIVAADAINSIVSKVKSAAQSEADGETEDYEEKVAELLELGYDEQQLADDIESFDASPSDDDDEAESIYSKQHYVTAVINNDPMADAIKQDLIDVEIQNGKTEEEVVKSLNNALDKAYKKEYYNGNMSDSEVAAWLKEKNPDDTDADIYWATKKWKTQANHLDDEDYSYSKYDEFYEAILDGDNITMNKFIAECRKYNNYKKNVNKEVASDIASAITSHFKPIYIDATPQERAILKRKLLNAYASLGYARSKRSDLIDKWLED